MMKKYINLFIELILFLAGAGFMVWANLNYEIQTAYQVMFSLCLLLVYAALYYLVPGKLNTLVFLLCTSFYYIYVLAQNVYFEAFGQYFRLSMVFSLKDEIGGSLDSVMEFIKMEYFTPLILLLVVSIVVLIIYLLNRKPVLKYRFRILISALCLVVAASGYCYLKNRIERSKESADTFMVYKTHYYVYHSIPSTTQFSNEFGFSGLLVRDAEGMFQKNQLTASHYDEIEAYLNDRAPYSDNFMTGIFEEKSLLMIQAESLMNLVIDETLTPTLYQMMHEGITIDGYSSPLLDGSTSSTEFMANLSLYPMNDDGYNPTLKYMHNTYKTTLANLFNAAGYKSYAFHNNYGEFYSRDIVMPNYGYNFFDSYALGLDSGASDSTYLEVAKWILLEKDKFFAYWITYNGHQPYDFEQNPEIEQYISLVQQTYPELSDAYVSYMAKTIDLDRSLQTFLMNAKDSGKADDIVIVIFGDHYAKGLVDDKVVKEALSAMNLPSEKEDVSKQTKTPLIIYSPSLEEPILYQKTSCTIDILPTISNMWGLEIDESTVLGNDIFSESYDGFYFNATETYMTDFFKYNYVKAEIIESSDALSDEEIMNEVNQIIERFEISKYILEMDYFKDIE